MASWLVQVLVLLPLDVIPPSPSATSGAVYPTQSNGFAAYVLGGFFGIGVLIVAMILLSMKPRRVSGR